MAEHSAAGDGAGKVSNPLNAGSLLIAHEAYKGVSEDTTMVRR